MDTDWAAVRAEFPALAEWTYLNTATFGQIPRRAVAAVEEHFRRRDRLACVDFLAWFDDADRIRADIAALIHTQPADIAFLPNAAAGLSLLLGGLDWRRGDRLVTLEHEFPNHYYYAEHLRHRGVEFVETAPDRLFAAITPQTRVVMLSTVNYSTGYRAPLDEIAPYLRQRGVLLYLDGTQSVGALTFDISRIQPDVFTVDAYKWLLSPNGAAFLYVHPELRAKLDPSVIGWRSHHAWRSPENLHQGAPVFSSEAEKYEGGMLAFPSLYALGASVRMMLEIGPERIEQRVLELADKTRALLRRAGGKVLSDSPIVTSRFEGRDACAIASGLERRRVLVAARQGNLRVSPHFYNNEEDLQKLECALVQALS